MSTTASTVVASTSNSELTSLRTPQWPEFVALAGYIVLIALAVAHHEPWADEAQAWQIARSVPLFDLFQHVLRYEGHPILWYAVLAVLNKLHIGYMGMHWFCGVVGCISTALLIFLSPLPRYIRLSLPFTFFLAFQYVVVARSYVLVPLLLFCLALAWRRSIFLVALLLGLMANVSMHSFAISVGFMLLYRAELQRGIADARRRQVRQALVIVGIFYLIAIRTVYPHPTDIHISYLYGKSMAVELFLGPLRICTTLCESLIQPGLLAVPLWIFVFRQFKRTGEDFYLLPIATFALACCYLSSFRHGGMVIPAAIAICWIAWPRLSKHSGWRPVAIGVVICVAVQCIWTIRAVCHHPYSPDLETARFLAPYVNAGDTMVVTYVKRDEVNAFHSIGLYPYFNHPIFLNEPQPYWPWSTRKHTFDQFDRAMKRNPDIVVAMFWDTHRFDLAKDLIGPRIERIQRDGYQLTNTFCAEKPEGFDDREETCFLIYERGTR
jgi:hypothetical protein